MKTMQYPIELVKNTAQSLLKRWKSPAKEKEEYTLPTLNLKYSVNSYEEENNNENTFTSFMEKVKAFNKSLLKKDPIEQKKLDNPLISFVEEPAIQKLESSSLPDEQNDKATVFKGYFTWRTFIAIFGFALSAGGLGAGFGSVAGPFGVLIGCAIGVTAGTTVAFFLVWLTHNPENNSENANNSKDFPDMFGVFSGSYYPCDYSFCFISAQNYYAQNYEQTRQNGYDLCSKSSDGTKTTGNSLTLTKHG
jgi:hypothetical protein